MCGIVGFYGNDKIILKRMTSIISHRGPDQEGFFIDNKISLGFRRLSIIDLSKKGNQPMFNDDESLVIVFNGEIYNYKEIRTNLESKKYQFKSDTDTEVIIKGYQEYGIKIFSKLNGIFGLAIFDKKNKKLLLARDQVGVKPLYYYYNKKNNAFVFGSEIKSILLHTDVPRKVNERHMNEYFTFRYVPGEETIFEDIKRVPPGVFLTFDLKTFDLRKDIFWKLSPNIDYSLPIDIYAKQLRKILDKSVQRQLMSDVPLGIYLSGGLDSSAVTAITKNLTGVAPKTFSIAFSDSPEKVNELRHARKVADYLATDHKEIILKPDVLWKYPEVAWHLEEPLSDASTIPTYYISEFSKKWVTVTLTGEGGDEAFGGYVQYKVLDQAQRFIKPIPSPIRKHLISPIISTIPVPILTKFFDYPSTIGKEGRERMKEFVKQQNDPAKTYLTLIGIFSEKEKKDILRIKSQESYETQLVEEVREKYFSDKKMLLDQIFIRENETWLPDWILSRLDKTTMAHSQESRVPLLDVELVEFAANIPRQFKKNKQVFRLAMRGELPKEIENRKKFPFYLPIDSWFGAGYKDLANMILSKENMSSGKYFNHDKIKKLLDNKNSSMLHSRQLWSLVTFEVWYKHFIDSDTLKKKSSIDELYKN
ncbi:MAG: asparagine synthase (glutamine-hydrolyzing) [Candidatus Woesearchaeota archaeon]